MPPISPLPSLPIGLLLQSAGITGTLPAPPGAATKEAGHQGGVLLAGNLPALLQQGAPPAVPLPGTPDIARDAATSRPAGAAPAAHNSTDGTVSNTGRNEGAPPGLAAGLAAASEATLRSEPQRRRATTVVAAADIPARLPQRGTQRSEQRGEQGAGVASPAKSIARTSLKLALASGALLLLLRLLEVG